MKEVRRCHASSEAGGLPGGRCGAGLSPRSATLRVLNGWLQRAFCGLKRHAHTVPSERWNHGCGVTDAEARAFLTPGLKPGHPAEARLLKLRALEAVGERIERAMPEHAQQQPRSLLPSRAPAFKKAADVHLAVLDF